MNCTAEGEDMSFETYQNALRHAEGRYIVVGGGEPTIHPDFRLFLIEAIAAENEGILCVTNGKAKKNALLLARLSKKGVVDSLLSQDEFHERISSEVINAFLAIGAHAIHDTSRQGEVNPINAGRAKECWEEDELRNDCFCDDIIIKPNGNVHLCGCENSPCIGNINDADFDIYSVENEGFQDWQCWNKIADKDREDIMEQLAA
jgi:MoaA/NifB/PqqE/SkfB family radical SAM enzyme